MKRPVTCMKAAYAALIECWLLIPVVHRTDYIPKTAVGDSFVVQYTFGSKLFNSNATVWLPLDRVS